MLIKTVFLLKVNHIQLNYVFLLFCRVFGKFDENFSFIQKVTISERSTEILRKITFLNKFEKEKIQRKICIWFKQQFVFKAVKWDNYQQKQFFSTK